MAATNRAARTCIVGGGPAGTFLGLLLARAGLPVVVMEKHHDFLRDFRGDTIHASTLQLFQELGLLERFLELPHQDVRKLEARVLGEVVRVADFSRLPHGRILLMPQWDFLEFVTSEARRYPSFELRMDCAFAGLLWRDGGVVGVRAKENGREVVVDGELVVGCDGRDSAVRRDAGLVPREYGVPMDVLWFRLPREASDPEQSGGFIGRGAMIVLLFRGDYWQAGFVIPKGGLERMRRQGLPALRAQVAETVPLFDARRLEAIRSWDDVRELRVQINRLDRWHLPGLLLIGDAAHAMSPIGGVGINLAIQDAVAAANILIPSLRAGGVRERELARVQRRRWLPTIATQAMQRFAQRRVVEPALGGRVDRERRSIVSAIARAPLVQRRIAKAVAMGLRPEHVRS